MSSVVFSSSYDEKNSPNNIFTSNNKEFFSTTGMFPQELCIQFDTIKNLNKINIKSYGIKKIEILTSENDSAMNFSKEAEQDNIKNGGLQTISLNLAKKPKVKVLKIEILEGDEDFCSIHKVDVA